jgi:hypothetical protein
MVKSKLKFFKNSRGPQASFGLVTCGLQTTDCYYWHKKHCFLLRIKAVFLQLARMVVRKQGCFSGHGFIRNENCKLS